MGKLGSDAGPVSPRPCDRSRGASGADPAPGHWEQLLLLPLLVPCSLPTCPQDSILGDAGPAFPLALSLPAPTHAAAAGLTARASAPFLQPHGRGGCLRGSGDWTPGREWAVGTRVMECSSHNESTGPDPVRSCQSTSRASVPELLWEMEPRGGECAATTTSPWSWEVADVILAVSHRGRRSPGASPPRSHHPARPA